MLISFVIPAKNEFPQIVWTIYSIIEAIPKDCDYEIILVDDASDDKTSSYWGNKANHRGLVRDGKLKIINISPENKTVGGTTGLGCWRARSLGFQQVKGDVTIFCDAHIVVPKHTIGKIFDLLAKVDEGLVHVPIAGLGDNPSNPYLGYSYKLSLQRRFWGEWTNRRLMSNNSNILGGPYTIAMGGFAMCGAKTEFLRKLGLWHDGFLGSYSGGEQYVDLKTWLLGYKVWLEPNTFILHSPIPRGYHFTNECMWWNTLVACYCVAGEDWMNMVYKNMDIAKYGTISLEKIVKLGKSDRKDIIRRQKYKSFDEMLEINPWEFPKKGSRFTNLDDLSLPDV